MVMPVHHFQLEETKILEAIYPKVNPYASKELPQSKHKVFGLNGTDGDLKRH
jgi:hypothetical protein